MLLSEFNGDVPVMNYYPDWDINLTTGAWRKFDPARNLALNKTATVSSAFPTHDATNVTAATTYQNYINFGWESAASDPQWTGVMFFHRDGGAASWSASVPTLPERLST